MKITGKETSGIIVEISLSTNKSFEWTEVINDGKMGACKRGTGRRYGYPWYEN